jgi:hypothetical protein
MLAETPNPKKSIVIERPIGTIKEVLPLIPLINRKFKKKSFDDILNLYTFRVLEFLSIGVYVDINLTTFEKDKTEVSVEIRRIIGSFDSELIHQFYAANKHIQAIFESISNALQMSEQEINELKEYLKNNPAPSQGCLVTLIIMISIALGASASAAAILF